MGQFTQNIDRVFRLPRIWSNKELAKFAPLFTGDVINVSGWKDIDKEGKTYREYFCNASSYTITNYKSEARGFQGIEGEIFLDLTETLPEELVNKFDVVFNHTVLEHIYEVHTAFGNLCLLSKDIIIIVVPFLQVMHGDYGDYWRFTPLTIKKMFEDNKVDLLYCTFNSDKNASVYIFCIGTKNLNKWENKIPYNFNYQDPIPSYNGFQNWIGSHAIQNDSYMNAKKNIFNRFLTKLKKK
jgi:hypothetical protein